MIQLKVQNIRLHVYAATKEEAIRAAGQKLIATGNIEPAYVESMLNRELQANTFLDNGIAIPHGMGRDRELIRSTGVCVMQLANEVDWGGGQMVRLVIGIAAKSDEHLEVLAAVTDMLGDTAIADRLAHTDDPMEIVTSLSGQQNSSSAQHIEELTEAKQIDALLRPGAGLHARPATNLVAIAEGFKSEIQVVFNGKIANGKAMASLIKLGAGGGAKLRLVARGDDADAALSAMKQAIESDLGDEDEKPMRTDMRCWVSNSSSHAISGICASPGIAIGPLRRFRTSHVVAQDMQSDPEVERQKLDQTIAAAKLQLQEIYGEMIASVGKNEAAIFRAHQAILADPELFGEAVALINARHSAAWSWQRAIEKQITEVKSVDDQRIAARASDLQDVGQRVLSLFDKTEQTDTASPDEAGGGRGSLDKPLAGEPCILFAEDLMPSDTAKLDPRDILGFVTVAGGPTSHTAIIARSLGIPAIVGASKSVLELREGITCILEGSAGKLYADPQIAELKSAREFQISLQQQRDDEHDRRYQPALMTDGHRVEVVANIGGADDAAEAVKAGAKGVGLLRSEFLFLDRETPPSEEEQYQAYSKMTRALGGLPLIVRTLDIGGDKVLPYLPLAEEDNPFLGVRGVRLCLRQPELFLPQLRAIYRASLNGSVKIMFPMVSTIEELREAKKIAEKVREEIGAPPIEIGIMIEVPSSAVLAAKFAKECDFFSIGTNDLTQYTLAMDRLHPVLGTQTDGLHPAVLQLINQTVRGAESEGKWVGVCGGIAGDCLGALILVGLGVTELSMSIPSIANVKAHLSRASLASAQALAQRALACTTAAEVHELGNGL